MRNSSALQLHAFVTQCKACPQRVRRIYHKLLNAGNIRGPCHFGHYARKLSYVLLFEQSTAKSSSDDSFMHKFFAELQGASAVKQCHLRTSSRPTGRTINLARTEHYDIARVWWWVA